MAQFQTIDGLRPAGKRVIVRADLNVPVRDGRVTDTTRLERLAPTLRELASAGARVVVMSHFGRPKGAPVPEYSLAPVARALAHVLGDLQVTFAADCIGESARAAVEGAPAGTVVVLENLRFHPGEEANDRAFAEELASLGDMYVNDAFSAAHRSHASIDALARLLPAAAGRLMQAEIEALGQALDDPARPLAAIVGGAKISTKLDVLGNLVAKTDRLIIGGAMANTFLHALGTDVGASLCERDLADTARAIAARAEAVDCALVLPVDAVVATALAEGVPTETVDINDVAGDRMILDIGPRSVAAVIACLRDCRTLVWNGPMGAFETPPFDRATNEVARCVAELTRAGSLLSVAGGGDTVAALHLAGLAGEMSYVSTAGGAFLEWLEGKTLPGVAALQTS